MRVVFVNGCFDYLHYGHISMFAYAKSLGDRLIVAIDSDDRIRQKKGYGRPYHNSTMRTFNLQSIKYIDEVAMFYSDEGLEQLVKDIAPDYMVVGEEYKDKKVIGSEHAKQVVFYPKVDMLSSTKIINVCKE